MALTRRRMLLGTAASCIALAGCTSGDGPNGTGSPDGGGGPASTATSSMTPSATSSEASTTVVEMVDTTFEPERVSVAPGTTVEWVNRDGYGHDVTAAAFHDSATDWNFTRSVSAGGSVTYTFEEAGVYEYYCSIHGQGAMCGVVLVGDVSLDAGLPCESGRGDSDGSDGGGDNGGRNPY